MYAYKYLCMYICLYMYINVFNVQPEKKKGKIYGCDERVKINERNVDH